MADSSTLCISRTSIKRLVLLGCLCTSIFLCTRWLKSPAVQLPNLNTKNRIISHCVELANQMQPNTSANTTVAVPHNDGIIPPLQHPELVRHNTKIPRILHQFWDHENIPSDFVENIRTLAYHNRPPEWEYYFWTLETSRSLIQDKYPEFLATFDALPDTLTRADASRYVIIHEYGGVYFDLDMVSIKPLAPFIDQHICAFVQEPDVHLVVYGVDFYLANADLFCRPRHPFFKWVLTQIPKKLAAKCPNAYKCTGPEVLTEFYLEYTSKYAKPYDYMAVVPTELFLDKYFISLQHPRMEKKCADKEALDKNKLHRDICDTWIKRGKEKMKISPNAFAYHKFDYPGRKLEIKTENNIRNIVPHARMYKSQK